MSDPSWLTPQLRDKAATHIGKNLLDKELYPARRLCDTVAAFYVRGGGLPQKWTTGDVLRGCSSKWFHPVQATKEWNANEGTLRRVRRERPGLTRSVKTGRRVLHPRGTRGKSKKATRSKGSK